MPRAAQRWTLLLASAATALVMMDITAVNVALPDIAQDRNAGFEALQWTVSAFSLALATFMMTAGALSDRLGRRRVFITGVAAFTVASAVCGLAPNVTVLAVARGFQGIAGALMIAPALALIAGAYAGRARDTAIGIFFTVGAVAAAVGPVVGGLLVEAVGWRWIFLINLPLGTLTGSAALARLVESAEPTRSRRLDLAGAALAMAMLFAVTYALIRQPVAGWSHVSVTGGLLLSGVLLAGFILIERERDTAMFDLTLFRIPSFCGAAVLSLAVRMTTVGMLTFFTLWLQGMLGHSPVQTGFALGLISVPWLFIAPLAGRLRKRFPAPVLIAAGFGLSFIGFLVMARVDPHGDWTVLLPGFLLIGAGGALVYPPLSSVAVSVVPPAQAGMASGITNSFFSLGTVAAVAVFGTVFSNGLARRLTDAELLRAGVPSGGIDRLRAVVGAGRFDDLPARTVDPATSAFAGALGDVCLAAAAVCGVAVLASLVMIREHDMTGQESTAEAGA